MRMPRRFVKVKRTAATRGMRADRAAPTSTDFLDPDAMLSNAAREFAATYSALMDLELARLTPRDVRTIVQELGFVLSTPTETPRYLPRLQGDPDPGEVQGWGATWLSADPLCPSIGLFATHPYEDFAGIHAVSGVGARVHVTIAPPACATVLDVDSPYVRLILEELEPWGDRIKRYTTLSGTHSYTSTVSGPAFNAHRCSCVSVHGSMREDARAALRELSKTIHWLNSPDGIPERGFLLAVLVGQAFGLHQGIYSGIPRSYRLARARARARGKNVSSMTGGLPDLNPHVTCMAREVMHIMGYVASSDGLHTYKSELWCGEHAIAVTAMRGAEASITARVTAGVSPDEEKLTRVAAKLSLLSANESLNRLVDECADLDANPRLAMAGLSLSRVHAWMSAGGFIDTLRLENDEQRYDIDPEGRLIKDAVRPRDAAAIAAAAAAAEVMAQQLIAEEMVEGKENMQDQTSIKKKKKKKKKKQQPTDLAETDVVELGEPDDAMTALENKFSVLAAPAAPAAVPRSRAPLPPAPAQRFHERLADACISQADLVGVGASMDFYSTASGLCVVIRRRSVDIHVAAEVLGVAGSPLHTCDAAALGAVAAPVEAIMLHAARAYEPKPAAVAVAVATKLTPPVCSAPPPTPAEIQRDECLVCLVERDGAWPTLVCGHTPCCPTCALEIMETHPECLVCGAAPLPQPTILPSSPPQPTILPSSPPRDALDGERCLHLLGLSLFDCLAL